MQIAGAETQLCHSTDVNLRCDKQVAGKRLHPLCFAVGTALPTAAGLRCPQGQGPSSDGAKPRRTSPTRLL